MSNLDNKLDVWKKKLLDLGLRNRMLNYKDTRRSNLKIKSPEMLDLWDSFVINEKPLIFPFVDMEYQEKLFDDSETPGDNIDIGSVVTNQTANDQQKTLRNIRNKAKTAMEEQGINILYLSFGLLRWNEEGHSSQTFDAPLILVPAVLTWESISSPFVLSLREDEIVVNPTLIYKLESEFGIKLPEIDQDGDISEYFSKINALISNNKWSLLPEVTLSLLSFLKINMYKDLESHRDVILQNPVIKCLCGDVTVLNRDLSEISDYDHDNTDPRNVFQVVDADSSQQDAILCAQKGISFVLQGPPGTGKSQTITNIIAECLADGKKILFVSEKMAALDVVHKRLTDVSLSDFCLILHSYKANKKNTLDQLRHVLNFAQSKAHLSEDAFQKLNLLQSDRNRLNEYSQAIFTTVSPLNKTIYEINGFLAQLQNYDEVIFNIDNVRQTSQQELNQYINILTRFVDTVGKMSDDYRQNPWAGANVEFVTNELRYDIGANLSKLIQKSIKITELSEIIASELALNADCSYSGLRETVSLLNLSSESPMIPTSWLSDSFIDPLADEIDACNATKAKFESVRDTVIGLHKTIKEHDEYANFIEYETLITTAQIDTHLLAIDTLIAESPRYSVWRGLNDWQRITTLYSEAVRIITKYNVVHDELLNLFEKEIFKINYNEMYLRFKADYTSFFKIFKKQYTIDRKQIQRLYREPVKKITDEEAIQVLISLRHLEELRLWMDTTAGSLHSVFGNLYEEENTDFEAIQRAIAAYVAILECQDKLSILRTVMASYEEQEDALKQHYEFLYVGLLTNWEHLKEVLNWTRKFKSALNRVGHSNVTFAENICLAEEKIRLCSQYSHEMENKLNDFFIEFEWFRSLFDTPDKIDNILMPALTHKMERCVNGLTALEEWIDFRTAKKQCCDIGLDDYVSKIEEIHIDSSTIIPIFKQRFYRLWLDSILSEFPVVANFRHKVQESTINEFASLDKLQFEIAKARIRSKLINDLPSLDHFTSGVDEISVLRRELNKQRRIMPIRKLFKEIPNLIMTLKPCLMMSPLSVSLFLEADSFVFDTVIFDEASQVCTENAIGAISRGKQVIIAGDSKQLPPTSFFTSSTSSDSEFDVDDVDIDNDEYDDSSAYESILDEAALLPERTLLWHYRSRHEHLIAFSNAKIYRNALFTFPSNIDKMPDNGVEYVYVPEGYYDRGGKKGNVMEAAKVAEMVIEHFKKHPNRSLGVIAFGSIQQQAIDAAIRKKRMENQQFEEFFNEERQDPFFTKSLENVQGDERDTIIFSIGYAKNAAGKMRMNFGPLSISGGERRLNVAITRAKFNVKLVGSIQAVDINTDHISADGPKLLRGYIDFAINGPSVLLKEIIESDIIEHDSPFEAAVYNFLDHKGYKLGTQVGCSGYRIDLAIKHPTISGLFVLGIECDGASYHSARTARERDRLRQDVLESMGWKIYRIWSTDWIKDPIAEGERLITVVENAIANYIEEITGPVITEAATKVEEFITVEKKEPISKETTNLYGFSASTVTQFNTPPMDVFGRVDKVACIELLVKNEYPLHYEALCQKISGLLGRKKATSVVCKEVDYALTCMEGQIIRKGDFFYPEKYIEIPIHIPNKRQIKHISVDELSSAMYMIASKCIGTTREALIDETTRAYGFRRRGNNITVAMDEAYEQLLTIHRIREIDGKISLHMPIGESDKRAKNSSFVSEPTILKEPFNQSEKKYASPNVG